MISGSLAKAGVDPALSKILTAVGSTALGATAGSATGGASGSTSGAAGALNEVANNYLSHSEALKREIALQQKQACTTDECRASAQRTINELNQVDAWRDAQLQTACATPSSSLCQGLNSALQIAKDSYNNYDPKSDINSTVAGERSQVNNQTFKYQQRVDNPFAYGVGKGLLKLSPPALVADVGYGAYSLTTAILENGLESTAINIAKGILDLPSELRVRLNSADPTVRGEALVDVIALGSSAAYLTQKLGLAVVNTADQAIAKAAAKAVEANSSPKAVELTFDKSTQTWTTPGGLDYGQGSIHGNRVQHVLDHTLLNPSKTTHSVFNVDRKEVLRLIDEAWLAKGNPLPNDQGTYIVPMGRTVGTAGESSIKIIVRPGTNKIITAFPFQ